MKSDLTFAAISVLGPVALVFVAAEAHTLPLIFEWLWHLSLKLSYDPLLVATFLLSGTLVLGKGVDLYRDIKEHRAAKAAAKVIRPVANDRPKAASAGHHIGLAA